MLLAIETSTSTASVALAAPDGEVVAQCAEPAGAGHGAMLLPLITRLLASAPLTWSQLTAVAVSIGPGAFTGIRVGLATAKGIAQARALPLIAVPTLLALAARAENILRCPYLLPMLDARRGEFYWALLTHADWPRWCATYDAAAWQRVVQVTGADAVCVALAKLSAEANIALCGTVPREVAAPDIPIWQKLPGAPNAAAVAELAAMRLQQGAVDDLMTLEPLYVRPSYAG